MSAGPENPNVFVHERLPPEHKKKYAARESVLRYLGQSAASQPTRPDPDTPEHAEFAKSIVAEWSGDLPDGDWDAAQRAIDDAQAMVAATIEANRRNPRHTAVRDIARYLELARQHRSAVVRPDPADSLATAAKVAAEFDDDPPA